MYVSRQTRHRTKDFEIPRAGLARTEDFAVDFDDLRRMLCELESASVKAKAFSRPRERIDDHLELRPLPRAITDSRVVRLHYDVAHAITKLESVLDSFDKSRRRAQRGTPLETRNRQDRYFPEENFYHPVGRRYNYLDIDTRDDTAFVACSSEKAGMETNGMGHHASPGQHRYLNVPSPWGRAPCTLREQGLSACTPPRKAARTGERVSERRSVSPMSSSPCSITSEELDRKVEILQSQLLHQQEQTREKARSLFPPEHHSLVDKLLQEAESNLHSVRLGDLLEGLKEKYLQHTEMCARLAIELEGSVQSSTNRATQSSECTKSSPTLNQSVIVQYQAEDTAAAVSYVTTSILTHTNEDGISVPCTAARDQSSRTSQTVSPAISVNSLQEVSMYSSTPIMHDNERVHCVLKNPITSPMEVLHGGADYRGEEAQRWKLTGEEDGNGKITTGEVADVLDRDTSITSFAIRQPEWEGEDPPDVATRIVCSFMECYPPEVGMLLHRVFSSAEALSTIHECDSDTKDCSGITAVSSLVESDVPPQQPTEESLGEDEEHNISPEAITCVDDDEGVGVQFSLSEYSAQCVAGLYFTLLDEEGVRAVNSPLPPWSASFESFARRACELEDSTERGKEVSALARWLCPEAKLMLMNCIAVAISEFADQPIDRLPPRSLPSTPNAACEAFVLGRVRAAFAEGGTSLGFGAGVLEHLLQSSHTLAISEWRAAEARSARASEERVESVLEALLDELLLNTASALDDLDEET